MYGIDQISKRELIDQIAAMGVIQGDTLALGVSLRSVGRIDGGVDALIDALLQTLGAEGTLMVATYNRIYPLDKLDTGKAAHVFDPRCTPCNTGAFAERIRSRSDAIRSLHPSNSITAIGRHSVSLTRDHDASAGAYTPFSKLAALNGRFLGIGIDDRLVGLRHEAQSRAGLLEIMPPKLGIFYRNPVGELRLFVRRDVGGCTKRLPALVSPLRSMGIVRDGKIGEARALLVEVKPALDYMSSMLRTSPQINLCGDNSCSWCATLAEKIGRADTLT